MSLREGLSLGHNYIGTEDLLLGLARENEGVAMQILLDLGADAEKIQNEVIGLLSGEPPSDTRVTPVPRPASRYSVGQVVSPLSPLLPGWLLVGIALGFGILVGWLIWG